MGMSTTIVFEASHLLFGLALCCDCCLVIVSCQNHHEAATHTLIAVDRFQRILFVFCCDQLEIEFITLIIPVESAKC